MKKICHMTSAHTGTDIRIFHKECVSLAKEASNDVFLVAPGESFHEKQVKVVGIGSPYTSRMKRMLFMARKVYQGALKIDADVYHIHDPELLPYAIKLKKKGKVVIYDSHEDVPRQILAKMWIPLMFRKIISEFYETYEKKCSRKLDGVVTATNYIKNIFEKYGCKAIAIKNYPMLEDIQCLNQNYEERDKIICYAGGVTEQRGITKLIDVINDMDVKLEIAGDISEEYAKKICGMKAWDKVEMLGYLNRLEVSQLYSRSRIGIVTLKDTPNHRHALPIKMFEYMAAGIPVVSSDFPVWKEIIDENQCGINVDPENEKQIESAIQKLLEDEVLAKQYGENGRKAVCEKYNWELEEKRLLKFYQILNTKKR